jgi:PAS domain S-box-containing protein
LLPWVANLLYNFAVGPFARIDLTPFAFIVTGAVLVWGLLREQLVNLTPVARGVVVESLADAVLVLDAFRRIVDANPAAAAVLGRPRGQLIGRALADLLTDQPVLAPQTGQIEPGEAQTEVTLLVDNLPRHFDARRQPLPDRRGQPVGEVVVLRDITERKQTETRLQELLADRTRVASALQASLLPASLPPLPNTELAGLYHPAGDGREIGGDFFDVFFLGDNTWGLVIGDVSGKGAEAATTTAVVRYTLRTLAHTHRTPSRTLHELNARLLHDGTDEHYCTLVYALLKPTPLGLALNVCLAGHHPPLLQRSCGQPEPVGRLGTALGLIDHPDLYDTKLTLQPADLLCLFTDGLVEARRGPHLFGSEGAAEELKQHPTSHPEQVAAALAAAARNHHGTDLADDLALLVLRVNNTMPPDGSDEPAP